MRINKDIARVVVFVGLENHGRFTPLGTGFLAAVQLEDLTFVFLVTSAHVVDTMSGNKFAVRLNRLDGKASSIEIDRSTALRPMDLACDVALFPLEIGLDVFDYALLPLDRANLEAGRRNSWDVGLGDEVAAVGLYTSHHGLVRNSPVVRIGNVAKLLGDEGVNGPGGYVDAYLIELRTIAGLSGSPVFVTPPLVRVATGGGFQFRQGEPVLPLGVLVGYHVVESKEDQIQVSQFEGAARSAGAGAPSPDERNTGFGVVIPIERVIEIVERADVQSKMAATLAQHRAGSGFRAASLGDQQ